MQDYKVKDISQADFGRKEISLAETEMPGLMAVRAEYKKLQETALKELDKIAYIRFASVYTNFKEVGEFGEYIEELDGKSKK